MTAAPHNQPRDYYYQAYFHGRGIRKWFHRRRINRLIALVPAGATVLDAGCGSGLTSHLLAKKGCAVTGIDIDAAEVTFAKETTPEGTFKVADLEALELKKKFRVVLCSEALEHFNTAKQAVVVGGLVRHLEPGGTLILTFPSSLYLKLEPVWKLVRRLLSPGIVWDDEDIHEDIGMARARELIAAEGLTAGSTSSMVCGLISVITATRPR